MTEYWRCKRCGRLRESNGCVCAIMTEMEPVAVVPVAELARLRGIETRVRDEDLAASTYGMTGHPANCWCPGCEGKRSRAGALGVYRRAVLGSP